MPAGDDYIKVTATAFAAMAFVLAFLFTGCGASPAPSGEIDLGGPWKIIVTEKSSPSLPGYDDSGAPEMELPGYLGHLLAGNASYSATIWLRKRVTIPAGITDRLMVLTLNGIANADEAYINGISVGATGAFPAPDRPLGYDHAWHRERHYSFPASLLRPGEDNVIALRAHYHMVNGVRDRPSLSTRDGWRKTHLLRELFPWTDNLIHLAVSVLLFILLGVTMQGTVNRNIAVYFAAFIISVFLVTILLQGLPRMENNIYRFKLFFSLYAFADFALLMFIQEFFSIRSRALTASATVLLLAFLGFTAMVPDSRALALLGAPLTAGLIGAYIAAALAIFFLALRRDPRRYWYLFIVAVLILASVADTLYCLATVRLYLLSHTFALRLPLLLLGTILVYLFDLKNARVDRDILTKALLKKTRELRAVKQRLPKQETKPEPRDAVHTLIEHLDGNFSETYDRLALARRFNMNEDYMIKLFKKVTGTNIANYINTRRIEAARQLLEETESRVIDIAFHVGFDNLTYFYRHFKKQTGYSPVEYRRMLRARPFSPEDLMSE